MHLLWRSLLILPIGRNRKGFSRPCPFKALPIARLSMLLLLEKMPHYEATLQSAPSESLQGVLALLQCHCRILVHIHGPLDKNLAMLTSAHSPLDAIDGVLQLEDAELLGPGSQAERAPDRDRHTVLVELKHVGVDEAPGGLLESPYF